MFKTLTLILTLFFISGCESMSGCQQETILQFDKPINDWVRVLCKDGVEYLSPEEGYAWLDVNDKEVLLFADLRQIDDEEIKGKKSGDYFESQVSEKLTGRHEVVNFNKDLTDQFGEVFEFKDIYYSRVFMEENRMSYELSFYVYKDQKSPAYLTITIGNGWVLEPMSYRVVKK